MTSDGDGTRGGESPSWGSFFVGGRRVQVQDEEAGDSYVVVGATYVHHYRPPVASRDVLPVLFVAGGGFTGAVWEHTPDGRPGWAVRMAATGRHVYVLDPPTVGRSGWSPYAETAQALAEHRTASESWLRFRFGHCDNGRLTPFAGQQFPVHHLDQLLAATVPRWRSTDALEAAGVAAAVERVGPCVVVAHSHGCALLRAAGALPHVRHAVEVEPLPHEPGAVPPRPTLLVWGDHMGHHPFFERRARDYAATPCDHLDLPSSGVLGNSHMPMSDRNSDAVLELVLDWLGDVPSTHAPTVEGNRHA